MAVLETVLDRLSSIVSAIAAVGAVIVSYLNFKKIQDVHVLINSRMTELLKVTGIASKAEGREEERDKNAKQ
jgi:hypothetical protein